ncbi:hypothetical protein B0T14DRAFT_194410 [Immersiella caudata]|uniref:Uncharacterized protein n=1 Tax=Immersiella caudata TaxID=314043 RepID=A0AA40C405_9PEZI|nr:hypothetical protein B0T14DRAFT_194410 [Immersiella caudata]
MHEGRSTAFSVLRATPHHGGSGSGQDGTGAHHSQAAIAASSWAAAGSSDPQSCWPHGNLALDAASEGLRGHARQHGQPQLAPSTSARAVVGTSTPHRLKRVAPANRLTARRSPPGDPPAQSFGWVPDHSCRHDWPHTLHPHNLTVPAPWPLWRWDGLALSAPSLSAELLPTAEGSEAPEIGHRRFRNGRHDPSFPCPTAAVPSRPSPPSRTLHSFFPVPSSRHFDSTSQRTLPSAYRRATTTGPRSCCFTSLVEPGPSQGPASIGSLERLQIESCLP